MIFLIGKEVKGFSGCLICEFSNFLVFSCSDEPVSTVTLSSACFSLFHSFSERENLTFSIKN